MFSYMKLFFCGAKETPVRKSVKGYRSSFYKTELCCSIGRKCWLVFFLYPVIH